MNKAIPEAVAFSALCVSCAAMEINGAGVSALWGAVVLWAFFSDWGQK